MKIYENIIIGNFLFSLGHSIGSKTNYRQEGCAINLLQQTPADNLLGDVMASFGHRVYLIEFKEVSNRTAKEKERFEKLSTKLSKNENSKSEKLISISKKIHWFIETDVRTDREGEANLISRVSPYLNMMKPSVDDQQDSLSYFIEQVASDITKPEPDYTIEDAKKYLELIREILGGGRSCGTGGLLLSAKPDGSINYIPLQDLFDLNKGYEMFLAEQKREWQQTIESKRHEIARKLKPKGYSMGF